MPHRCNFKGRLTINDNVEEIDFSIFMTDCSVFITDKDLRGQPWAHHRQLSFFPFHWGMIVTQSAKKLSTGSLFNIASKDMGLFSEGCSAPYGEGEFDCRPIHSIQIEAAYHPAELTVKISGTAVPNNNDGKLLNSWSFVIEFNIPRTSVRDFAGFGDLGIQTFDHVYDQHVKHA